MSKAFTKESDDDELELRMLRLLAQLMHDNDAPRSQFERRLKMFLSRAVQPDLDPNPTADPG